MATKTVRRDWLKRQVKAGKVTVVDSYSFCDMLGTSRCKSEIPAALSEDFPTFSVRKQGVCYMLDCDFDSSCGRAWRNDNGTVTLYVHSNLNYTFKIST